MVHYKALSLALVLCLGGIPSAQAEAFQSQEIMVIVDKQSGQFTLPPLPFSFTELEPYIDAKTVDIHYNKHHKAYVDNLNKAIQGSEWQKISLLEMFKSANTLPASVKNNAGGHWNHSFYWACFKPNAQQTLMPEKLEKALIKNFGSVENFKQEFVKAGLSRLGSGWVWLVLMPDGSLKITSSLNQDNPLMNTSDVQGKPLLTCDVWEHAYYLKYQNRRDMYLDSFWNLVDWNQVLTRMQS